MLASAKYRKRDFAVGKRIKYRFFTTVCLFIFFSSPSLAENIKGSNVGSVIIGTAFLYNENGDMFTNRHVVDNCDPSSIIVSMKDGEVSNASVIAISSKSDIAAISTTIRRDTFASFRTYPSRHVILPAIPEDVFTAGFTNDSTWKNRIQGTWGQVIGFVDEQNSIAPDGKTTKENIARMNVGRGASGSPILDYHGLLVGIVYGGHEHVF